MRACLAIPLALASSALLVACSSGSSKVRVSGNPVFADDATALANVPVGTELPFLQAYLRISAAGDLTEPTINSDDASLTTRADGLRLKVESLNRSVVFRDADAEVDLDGVIEYERAIGGGRTAFLQRQGPATGLTYTDFGAWAILQSNGRLDVAYGAVGLQTRPANVPDAGSANYTGTVVGVAIDGSAGIDIDNDIYDLIGDAALTANFGTGAVTGTFSNMTATNGATTAWNTVTIDAAIAGGGFAGDTAVTGANANQGGLGAGATGAISGRFYGPAAEEMGGAWTLGDGTVSAAGSFGAATP